MTIHEPIYRAICPVCYARGVMPRWEPVRGFLKCEVCASNESDPEWPDSYDYSEWARRAEHWSVWATADGAA